MDKAEDKSNGIRGFPRQDTCHNCLNEYRRNSPVQKRCSFCQHEHEKRKRREKYRRKNGNKKVGNHAHAVVVLSCPEGSNGVPLYLKGARFSKTDFDETHAHGYFPDGMVVRYGGVKRTISGKGFIDLE